MLTTTRPPAHAPTTGCNSTPVLCDATRHGTAGAYGHHGCRCPAAIRDKKLGDYERATGRPRTVDATGTRRRIQALLALGWPGRQIMTDLGWPGASLGAQVYQQTRVTRQFAQKVATLYDRLADTPGPSSRTRIRAGRAGYLPPLWWDADSIDDPAYTPPTREPARPRKTDVDPVRVDRAIAGQPVDLTRAERLDAVRQLRARHLGYDAIADRLRVAARQVHRDLTDLGLVQTEAGAA